VVVELLRRVEDAQIFLKLAAIELRRIAEASPDIAAELQQVAEKIEAEAEGLARREGEAGSPNSE
jgi:hypothetical protein